MKQLVCALLLLSGAAAQAQDVVAQRGSLRLSSGDVREMVAHAEPGLRAKLQSDPAVLSAFVRDQLLRQSLLAEARARNWEQTPEVAARLAEAREQIIVATYLASLAPTDPAYPSDAELAAAYEANKPGLMRPRQYQLQQIVLLVPPGSHGDEEARKRLLALRQAAGKPRADFAELARQNSQDKANGELGWVREDQLLPAIKDAVAGLQEGGISDPVHGTDAWHLVKLLATRPAGPAPLAEVRDQLVQALRQQRARDLTKAALDENLRKDPIRLNEIALQGLVTR